MRVGRPQTLPDRHATSQERGLNFLRSVLRGVAVYLLFFPNEIDDRQTEDYRPRVCALSRMGGEHSNGADSSRRLEWLAGPCVWVESGIHEEPRRHEDQENSDSFPHGAMIHLTREQVSNHRRASS